MVKIDHKIAIKTPQEIQKMVAGGKILKLVKKSIIPLIAEGVDIWEIEEMADAVIRKNGAFPSFRMVDGYKWATCINLNSGLVHGIPKKGKIIKSGDVVSVDVGVYYKGFHTDSSITFAVNPAAKTVRFLQAGEKALSSAVSKAVAGGYMFDISDAMEREILKVGASPIKALVGHGVGKNLHEEPAIPCVAMGARDQSPRVLLGMTLAIEVMYAMGSPEVYMESDGWTILTRDGKISALFEETVAVTSSGPLVIT